MVADFRTRHAACIQGSAAQQQAIFHRLWHEDEEKARTDKVCLKRLQTAEVV